MPKQKSANQPETATIRFEGDIEQKFETVKQYYGLKNNTDVLRLLITLKHEELKKSGEL